MRKIAMVMLSMILVCAFTAGVCVAEAKWKIKFGHDQREKSPHHDAALYLKKLIEDGSNGEIAVQIFPNQTLGKGVQMVEMVQAGALELLAVPASKIQVLQPSFQLLDLPFLFPDKKRLYDKLYGDFGKKLFEPLTAHNIVGLSYWGMGFKQLTGNFPIHRPADFNGKKIRVMPSAVIREQFKALGASPVPIDFHDLYNALQQGVVDGQENPLVGITTMKLYEVQKYMAISNHAFLTYGVIAGKAFFDTLPPEYQRLLQEAADKSAQYQLGLIDERDEGFLNTIREAGVEVTELTPEARSEFQRAMDPVYQWFVANVDQGQSYLDMIRN